jgi:hypothetical protein
VESIQYRSSNSLYRPERPRELVIVDTARGSIRGQGLPHSSIVGWYVVHAPHAVFGVPRAMALWGAVLQEPPGVARVVISLIVRGQCVLSQMLGVGPRE